MYDSYNLVTVTENNDAIVIDRESVIEDRGDHSVVIEYDKSRESNTTEIVSIARSIVIEMANKAVDVWARRKSRILGSQIQSKMWSFLATKPGDNEGGDGMCSVGNSSFNKKHPTTGGKKTLRKKTGPTVTRARKRKVENFDFDFELRGHRTKKIKQYFYVESEPAADNHQEMEPPMVSPDEGEMEAA